ncbi:N-acetylmuramoyl-L-alanine amidase [Streptomyces scopuliridis]|uniref:N-acetylmuramoyl-L-alanine amidase n=1 Tax=Streptomyces scopuliridis TaxID=452529 RepID=A0ACD4ZFA7_9ACTN|nr:hypothetical protein [Streptomyces scopuliridis]WSB97064.1 N-acetylmuramoyl-L-alanine amidase [Streptomyces scopuliridis]WSC09232.1 N-acetylmuramoyl-L-alanine amidase [Streptomyces scopuliridis]
MSPRTSHAYRPLSIKRRAWLTIGAVVLGGAGVVTYAVATPSADRPAPGARAASVRTLKLEGQGTDRRNLPKKETQRFSAVLLTWPDAEAELKGRAEVRSRDLATGEWSGWQPLPDDPFSADGAEGERAVTRGGTASVWTGDSDGVEVRVVAEDRSTASALPAGMDVKLLDPGTDPKGGKPLAAAPAAYAEETTPAATPTDSTAPTDSTTPSDPPSPAESAPPSESPSASVSPSAPASPSASASPGDTVPPSPSPSETVPAPRPSTVVKPPVISQAQWGASTDYDGTPTYGQEIKAAVVHHTGVDSDNGVSCAQSRARQRTIQQDHSARGYYDIGYNFVVDRCGQITLHQDSTGVPGTGETGDDLGASVAVGDYNLDGYDDVLAGAPNEDITRDGASRTDAGTALLFRGSATGMTGTGALSYSQDTTDIAGATESGDRLASSVVLHDLSGFGRADLAIGADGEDGGDGVILQLDSGSAGISAQGGVYYSRSNLGTPATARLGRTLAP